MFLSYQLTLNGSIQRLSDAFGDGVGIVRADHDVPFRTLTFQALKADSNDIYIGGSNQSTTVSSTKHGFRVDSTDSALPIVLGGFDMGGPMKLSDFWVLGTNAEVLVVGGVAF